MKKSTKAVLLSALVFPGAGHIFLKKYILGVVLVSASFIGIYYLVSKTVQKALLISEKIQNGEVQLNLAEISELMSNQSTAAEAGLINIVTVGLIICWIVGIIDSYRAGCVQDKDV